MSASQDLRVGVGPDFLRMNHAGDGVAKLDLRIAHAVAADHRASGLHHLGEAAGKNLLQYVEIAFIGKADNGQRGHRASAHGVNVAQRVGGRDLAEGVWVVNDGREEIHGLDERLRRPEILYTPASSAVSKPTSTFGSFCRANFPSTVSSAAGLSLLAQPAALTCSVSRIVLVSAISWYFKVIDVVSK